MPLTAEVASLSAWNIYDLPIRQWLLYATWIDARIEQDRARG